MKRGQGSDRRAGQEERRHDLRQQERREERNRHPQREQKPRLVLNARRDARVVSRDGGHAEDRLGDDRRRDHDQGRRGAGVLGARAEELRPARPRDPERRLLGGDAREERPHPGRRAQRNDQLQPEPPLPAGRPFGRGTAVFEKNVQHRNREDEDGVRVRVEEQQGGDHIHHLRPGPSAAEHAHERLQDEERQRDEEGVEPRFLRVVDVIGTRGQQESGDEPGVFPK